MTCEKIGSRYSSERQYLFFYKKGVSICLLVLLDIIWPTIAITDVTSYTYVHHEFPVSCCTLQPEKICQITTVFIDTRLWKTQHPRKSFQNFCQSYVLLTDRIEIHQSQPLA